MDELCLASEIFEGEQQKRFRITDRVMAILLLVEWMFAISFQAMFGRSSWNGAVAGLNAHLIASVLGGAVVTVFPVYLCTTQAGSKAARYSATIAQVIWSALFIHLSGGRIDTHFHVFVSLAILSNYRDWRVLPIATSVILFHHAILGSFFPESVFGAANPERWRWVEHALWVVFEDVVLAWFCVVGNRETWANSRREAQLQLTKNSIEEQVIARTELLETAMKEANRASEAKSQFLTNISHEIKTPINGIMGNLHFLSSADLDEDLVGHLNDANSSMAMLAHVLNNVLTLSELQSDRLELRLAEIDLDDILSEACGIYERSAAIKGLEFVTHLSPMSECLGDSRRIRQIACNLLSNAVKFTQTGKVSLTSRFSGTSETDLIFVLEVADTGQGISEEQQGHLFESFYQADSSSTRRFGGVGIGLSICKQLVSRMEGQISFVSELGRGSTFTVTLPMKRIEARKGHDFSSRVPILQDRLEGKVLIVDSVGDSRSAVAQIVRQFGLSASVESAETGITPERLYSYDAVLIDIRNRDELKTLSQQFLLRTNSKIVLAPAELCNEELEIVHGADAVLARPVNVYQLHRTLKGLLSVELALAA